MTCSPTPDPFWKSLPDIARTVVQGELVAAVESEATNHVRNKVCEPECALEL